MSLTAIVIATAASAAVLKEPKEKKWMAPMVAAAYAAPYAYPHSYAGPACGYYPLSAHVNPNIGRVSQSLPGMMNIVSIILCRTRLINAGRCFHRQSVVERHRARDASGR